MRPDAYIHIVMLLCSTVPEYIGSDDPNFFVREDLPCVAPELRDYPAEATEEEPKAIALARRIGDG